MRAILVACCGLLLALACKTADDRARTEAKAGGVPPDLPRSSITTPCSIARAKAIVLSPRVALVQGRRFAVIHQGRLDTESAESLTRHLGGSRANTCASAGAIEIRADRSLPYRTLYQVAQAAARGGWLDFCLRVEGGGKLAAIETTIPSACGPRSFGERHWGERSASPAASPKVSLAVYLRRDRSIEVTAASETLGAPELRQLSAMVPPRGGSLAFDYQGLRRSAATIHRRYPQSRSVLLFPHSDLPVQDLVSAMDALRSDGRRTMFGTTFLSIER